MPQFVAGALGSSPWWARPLRPRLWAANPRRARAPPAACTRRRCDDLKFAETTPSLSYITPNLCNNGHDSPCVDGSPGGLERADAWLQEQVPAILDSPAFRQDGMLVITFDETEDKTSGPAGIPEGTAGGRVGALVLSPSIKGGTTSDRMYNHYSLLASIEDAFALPRLGYADPPGLASFGADVLNGGS